MPKGKCAGLFALLFLCLVALVGWELYEPMIADEVAAESARLDALHAALAKAREKLPESRDRAEWPILRTRVAVESSESLEVVEGNEYVDRG